MEELFPSEIARLVLGYLKESKCENAWKAFLEESTSLQEYCQLYKRGKFYPTNVNGKSLSDILSEYCFLKGAVNNDDNNEFVESRFQERCKVILEEIITNAVERALPKYIPCLCYNNHHKISCPLDLEQRADNCIELGNEVEKNGESNRVFAHKDSTAENNLCNYESNMDLNVADCSINHSGEQSGMFKVPGVPAANHNISLVESSIADSVYLQEIIKVEKDSDNYSILENTPEKNMCDSTCSQDLSSDELINGFPKNNNDLRSTENKSKIVENPTAADSASKSNEESHCNEVEIIKTVKLERNIDDNCNVNRTANADCFQNTTSIINTQRNGNSTVEISQTSLCNIQSNADQVDNLGNSINSSNNQSGYALQATPFSNQSVSVNDMSFSTVPTYIVPSYSSNGFLQNNAQCSIVINAPSIGGFPLTLPSIQSNSLGPVLTSIDTIRSNNTPSVPTICVSNAVSPVLTAVDPVMSRNAPSASGISVNSITNPVMTTVNTAAVGRRPLTVSSLPANASSSVYTAANTVYAISNSSLITSDSASKSSRKLTKIQTSTRKACKRKNASELSNVKETNTNEPQSKMKLTKGKWTYSRQQSKRLLPSSSGPLESDKKMASKSRIPDASNPEVQCRLIKPKKKEKRKGK